MGLNRAQKRHLAVLLAAQAKRVVNNWDDFSGVNYTEIPDGGLDGILADQVEDIYAQWLKYLPHDAWNRVGQAPDDEPAPVRQNGSEPSAPEPQQDPLPVHDDAPDERPDDEDDFDTEIEPSGTANSHVNPNTEIVGEAGTVLQNEQGQPGENDDYRDDYEQGYDAN